MQQEFDNTRMQLLPCIRYDKLNDKMLVNLSQDKVKGFEGKGLMKGYENLVINALCTKLQEKKPSLNPVKDASAPRNYMKSVESISEFGSDELGD